MFLKKEHLFVVLLLKLFAPLGYGFVFSSNTPYTMTTDDPTTTTTTPHSGCVQHQFVSIYGNAFSTLKNVPITTCCEICQKISECVLAEFISSTYPFQDASVCNLYNNVTSIVNNISSKNMALFPGNIPYKCNTEENRLYYELTWTEIDQINTKDSCIEICTFDGSCKSWMFLEDSSSCLTSTMNYTNTKWVLYSGMTTGTCSFNF